MSTPKTFSKAVEEVSNLLVLKYLEESGFKKVSKKLQKLTQTSSDECAQLQFLNLRDVRKHVERESRRKKRKFQKVIHEKRAGKKSESRDSSPRHQIQHESPTPRSVRSSSPENGINLTLKID